MKRLLLLFGALGAGIAMLFGVFFGVGGKEIWLALRTFSMGEALMFVVLTGVFLLMGAMRWKKILESQGQKIPLASIWKMYIGGFSLLFFVPILLFANEIFRSSTLKEQHGIGLKQGMASVIIDRILEITVNLLTVIAGGVIFLFLGDTIGYSIKTAAIGAFIGIWLVVLCFLYIRLFRSKSVLKLFWRGNGYTKEVEEEVFRFFHVRNKFFWQGVGFSFLRGFVGLIRVWALVLFLGKGVIILPGITILGFYYLALLVPIPAALGSHDALQAAGFSAFGMGAGGGAAFALLTRATEGLFALAGLFVVVHLGFRVMGSVLLHKGEKFIKAFSQ